MVIAKSQVMIVGNVPVDAGKNLVVFLVGREAGPRTGVISVLVLNMLAHALKVGKSTLRYEVVSISHTILRSHPAIGYSRSLYEFTTGEEEELILDNRSSESKSVSSLTVLLARTWNLLIVNGITTKVLILMIDISRTLVCVGTRLSDSVHTTTDEVGLTYIKRRDNHLHFLDSVDRDRITSTRKSIRESEVLIEVGTVNSEVGSTTVRALECHSVTSVGREASHVCDRTAYSWHGSHLSACDVRSSTHSLDVEFRSLTLNNHFAEHLSVFVHCGVEVVSLTELEYYTIHLLGLITNVADGDLVRTARTHTIDVKLTFGVCYCYVACARRSVDGFHSSTDNILVISLYLTRHARRSYLCHC